MNRVLIIEDEPYPLEAIATPLKQRGLAIDTATSLHEAEKYLEAAMENDTPYVAVLTDYWLKSAHSNGDDTYEAIRIYCGKSVPIIASSSDMTMWEKVLIRKNDPHLHLVNKVYTSVHSVWDEPRVTELLTRFGCFQPAPTA